MPSSGPYLSAAGPGASPVRAAPGGRGGARAQPSRGPKRKGAQQPPQSPAPLRAGRAAAGAWASPSRRARREGGSEEGRANRAAGERGSRRQSGTRRPDPCPTWSPLTPPIPHPPASGSLAWIKGTGVFTGASAEGMMCACNLHPCMHVYVCADTLLPSDPALHKERAGGKQMLDRRRARAAETG